MTNINVYGPKDPIPKGITFNVTSQSKVNWCKSFSPFYLGPIQLYDGRISKNMENAWQFSKVYSEHVDNNDLPNQKWLDWSTQGFDDKWAHRYPMGKGAKPLYSWNGKPLDYIQARKYLYIPWYVDAVKKIESFKKLKEIASKTQIWLFDYDGYDFKSLGMTYEDVLNYTKKPMGHGIILAAILEDENIDSWRIKK